MIDSAEGYVATVIVLAAAFPALAARWRLRLFEVLPPIVLAYAATMLLAVAGTWERTTAIEATRGQLLTALLPALVFLLLVPCDLQAVARVGPRLLLAFALATITILAGFVAAWLAWRSWLPEHGWQVLAMVAGGWIGGTANLVAVAGGLEAPADAVGLAVVTDTVCYFCWVLALFSAAPAAAVFNRWSRGVPAAATNAAPTFDRPEAAAGVFRLLAWLAAGLAVGQAAALLAPLLPTAGPLSTSSWRILLATLAGVLVAQTPLRSVPGSAPLASALLFVVVVTMATQATLAGLASAPVFVAAGFTVLACHALGMAVAARFLRLDLASCSVASLANIGGVASAPLMAALHAPALTPVAVLLALLGYLVGMPAGLGLAAVLQRLGVGLAPVAVAALLASLGAAATAADDPGDRRTAAYWVARCPAAEQVLLDGPAVAAFNARLCELDPSVRDLAAVPERLSRAAVEDLLAAAPKPPSGPLYHADGRVVGPEEREAWQAACNLGGIPAEVEPQFGLLVGRTDVRGLPTATRVLKAPADTDLDRLRETALFPGTPVAVLHRSADGRWAFILAPTYAGWVLGDAIAAGSREEVLGYVARCSRVVTGSRAFTAFTPEAPELSRVELEMGVSLPELADWPRRKQVNGQVPLAAQVIELPTRTATGSLAVRPAALPLAAETHAGPLPASRANLIRQACKFLGERYGWGHDYEGRDCSGLVGEAYRSLGILLPRNTSDHVRSPALDRLPLAADLGPAERLAAIGQLLPGDLIYAPRHVMIVIGHDPDPWVIHATHGGWDGPPVNGVVIMPLAEIGSAGGPILDTVTTLIRVLPRP